MYAFRAPFHTSKAASSTGRVESVACARINRHRNLRKSERLLLRLTGDSITGTMGEFIRFLYLVLVVLPLGLLFIGPLLTLAALRGVQQVGPLILNPSQQGVGGRIRALILGLLLWLAVWGGLAVLLGRAGLPAIGSVSSLTLQTGVAPTLPVASPPPSPTRTPSASPMPQATSTPTRPEREETPPASPSLTPSPMPPTRTPTSPTATTKPLSPSPAPSPTATPTPLPAPIATLSPEETSKAISTVESANELLRAAVIEPSIGNLAELENLWRGEALAKAQAFAQDLYQRYLRPLEVTFTYILPPVALEGTSSDSAIVISSESWTYTGPRASYRESFEFTYTLSRQDEGWVITEYGYRNVPSSLPPGEGIPTPISTPVPITTTAVITSSTPSQGL